MTSRSMNLPAFQAPMTPSGTATSTDTIRVQIASDSVGSTRCAIRRVTGRLVKIEMPRSPCSTAQAQVPKRVQNGSLSPSFSRMRSMSWTVAMSPAITAAGSPGVR